MDGAPAWVGGRVVEARRLTPTVLSLALSPDGGPLPFTAGSHISVEVAIGDRHDVRQYSLVGRAPADGAYRIAVRSVDDSRGGSRHMWSLREGDEVRLTHPRCLFAVALGAPEYLLVAGGIGINPLVGMAEELAAAGERFRLLYAGRRRDDMPYASELLDAHSERVELFAGDAGARLDLLAEIRRLHPGGELYVCGPMAMLETARRLWRDEGRDPTRLRFETFASSGTHPVRPFDVRFVDLGRTLRVGETDTILSAMEAAGLPAMYDCRRGECGLCAVDVLGADAQLDHRDVFLSEAERVQMRKVCTCVSRAVGGTLTVDSGYRGT